MQYAKNPSSFSKLLSSAQRAFAVASEDLATYVDASGFEYVLVTVIPVTIGTITSVAIRGVEADAANGTGLASIKDEAGADIVKTLTTAGSDLANGRAVQAQFRMHGRKKFFSPGITCAGAGTALMAVIVEGIGPRDTTELESNWPAPVTPAPAGSFSTVVAAAGTYG